MNTAEVIYLGGLMTEATHVRSGSKMQTDAPTDNFGKGSTFSPTDLVATALAQCMITTVAIQTRLENLPLEGSKMEVVKHMSSNPRRISKIEVKLTCDGKRLDENQRKRIEEIALNCPVAKSLHPDLEQAIVFEYM